MPNIHVSFRDGEGHLFPMTLYRDDAGLLVDDTDDANDLVALIAALTDCVVASVSIEYPLASSRDLPAGTVEGEIQAAFGFLHADDGISRVTVPGFKPALKISGTDLVDQANAAVAAFITAMTGGVMNDYRGAELESVAYAVEHYAKKRK
jgi:hypothetical protein